VLIKVASSVHPHHHHRTNLEERANSESNRAAHAWVQEVLVLLWRFGQGTGKNSTGQGWHGWTGPESGKRIAGRRKQSTAAASW